MTTEKLTLNIRESDQYATEPQSVLEKLKPLIANADLQLPCCVDNYICREGDGNGKWFIFDSSFNDGPPFGEFYNAESDARLVCALLNFAPSLIAALELVEAKAKEETSDEKFGYATGVDDSDINFARELIELINGGES